MTRTLLLYGMSYKDPEKQKEAQRKSYLKNKQKVVDGLRHRRRRNKEVAWKVKKELGCQECGFDNPAALDYHHPNDDKLKSVAQLIRNASSLDILNEEIKKCIVLCANCHKKEHSGSRDRWNTKKEQWVLCLKEKLSCECGENYPSCLEFHHRDKDSKIKCISDMCGAKVFTLQEVIDEIEKCDVLCSNCHRILHHEEKETSQFLKS